MEKIDLFSASGDEGPRMRRFTPPVVEATPASTSVGAPNVEAVDVRSEKPRKEKDAKKIKALMVVAFFGVVALGAGALAVSSPSGGPQSTAGGELSSETLAVSPFEGDHGLTDGDTSPSDTEVDIPRVQSVRRSLVIEFDERSSEVTSQSAAQLTEFAESLAPGEIITVTSHAGFSAGEEWAETISALRGEALGRQLAGRVGPSNVLVIPSGRQPASLDEAAAEALEAAGIRHNRVAIVSVVDLED